MPAQLTFSDLLSALKAAGEESRLRILILLAGSELTVSDLTYILEQSQPRISRHLRLLDEAGLIERVKEGSWVYCRLRRDIAAGDNLRRLLALVLPDDAALQADAARLGALKAEREKNAQAYFARNAGEWDRIRSLHAPESRVENAMTDMIDGFNVDLLVDLGTGTGRMLSLFAGQARRLIGFDVNHAMLEYARTRLDDPRFSHCMLRQSDLHELPLEDGCADIVILHQVLHFLPEPERAIAETARILKPDGRLLIADFAPHELEFLREEYAHLRLGLDDRDLQRWFAAAGLAGERMQELKAAPHEAGVQLQDNLTVLLWLARKTDDAPRAIEAKDSELMNIEGLELTRDD